MITESWENHWKKTACFILLEQFSSVNKTDIKMTEMIQKLLNLAWFKCK